MPRQRPKPAEQFKSPMKPSTSELIRIVTDLDEATNALPQHEREAYREAQRSVVEARFHAETPEGRIRIL